MAMPPVLSHPGTATTRAAPTPRSLFSRKFPHSSSSSSSASPSPNSVSWKLNRGCWSHGISDLSSVRVAALSHSSSIHRRLAPPRALPSDAPPPPHPIQKGEYSIKNSKKYKQWDALTAMFAATANIPFLLLQLPQIILNARNLSAGNKTALLAIPWMGMFTGLLGNLSLLSYFSMKREKEVMLVQTLGVISQYVVFAQLAMAEAMPWPYFLATSGVVGAGLLVNFMNYFYMLDARTWALWEDFNTIGGLSVLPQIIWSTFVPYVPNTILPGIIAFFIAVTAVIMARTGRLSEKSTQFVAGLSGWTATLLFMWMPVTQMWTNFLNPKNIKGLSPFSMLLAAIGNGLMLPRALLSRDLMWFTGSLWATLFYGYGNIVCLYMFNSMSKEFFLATTAGVVSWIVMTLWKDAAVHGHNSPATSLKDLVAGS